MDISQTLTQTNTPISQPQAEIDVARAQIDADFDLFLQMLTSQAKYQDPLDPMDNSEYATQLATFSGVEQAVLLCTVGKPGGIRLAREIAIRRVVPGQYIQ